MNGSDAKKRLLVNTPAACELLSIGRTVLLEMVRRGELPVVRIGRAVRFRVVDLQTFVDERVGDGA